MHSIVLPKKNNIVKLFFGISIAAFLLLSCNNQQKDKVEEEETGVQKNTIKVDPSMNNISRSKDIATLLCQHWEHKGDHELPYLTENDEDPVPMRAFYFFNDGSLVKDPRNTLQIGKWAYDDASKQIEMSFAAGIKKRYKIKSISYKKLLLLQGGESQIEEYRAEGVSHKNNLEDPFYPANLQWMIKPMAAESDDAIRQRLKAVCIFIIYFMTMLTNGMQKKSSIMVFRVALNGMAEVFI